MAATADSLHVLTVVSVAAPREGGGNAERAVQLARAFDRQGLRSTLLTLDIGDWQARKQQLEGAHLIALPCILKRFHVPMLKCSALRALVQQTDIIHMKGYWSLLHVLVWFVARIEGVPWVLSPGGALPIFGRSTLLKRTYNLLVGHRLVRGASGWIANTRDEVAHFAAYGIPSERVEVFPNGVDETDLAATPFVSFRTRLGLERNPYLLFMGRLSPIKGPDLLLEAFIAVAERQPALHLVFAGPDDGMQEGLATRAASAGLAARVHFPGFVGGAEKTAAYREAVLLAVPSRSEAMSIVAVECGLCGTPVLMTDRCGLRDLDEVDLRLTVQATSDGLAAGLDYALADTSRRLTWGAHWQAIVRERFLWKDIAVRMAGWLAAIATAKHRRPT